ncbi:DUF1292 domain-containing protein [Clostridium perfringens]|uniref:DUF1292 domain-containing protein n=1 Tax=Clostridium perfringens TaxID=1502 RepID=UPI0022450C3E|nr:DUF1292 domain-containing protein [Clostridium perfringens]MCX0384176.1 DUF1292 domain-containing protein [Clostridium perfringens]MDT7930183.1 DUF1292 domain-containing protein [Clostridium perfringens]MDT7954361.1 DUF1292 domain-containing protein [Clostridium perfringens]
MEEKQIMAFRDEEGNKVEFEVVAKIYLGEKNKKEYIVLSPVEGKGDEADDFVFRVDKVNDSVEYNLVEDDEEFRLVKKEYKKLLY